MPALPVSNEPVMESEYLALERESEIRHAYIDGDIDAMSDASEAHNLITGSTFASLYNQLRARPCRVYPSDMKVRTPATSAYFYPDITVVCGEPLFSDDRRDVLLNPAVIVEHFVRQSDGLWGFSDLQGLQATLMLKSLECELALADIYEQISFGE